MRWLPETILNSYSRHSIAPFQSGTRRDGCRRISFAMRWSAVKKWQRQPANLFFSASPSFAYFSRVIPGLLNGVA